MNSVMYSFLLIGTLLMCFTPTTRGQNVPDPSCPVYTATDFAEIVADPSDCTKFFICDAGRVKRSFECPCGLLFNSTLKVCDWPDNVNCTQPPRACTVPTTPSTTTAAAVVEAQAQNAPIGVGLFSAVVSDDRKTAINPPVEEVAATTQPQGVVEEIPPQ